MPVHHYYIYYVDGLQGTVVTTETAETHLEISNLEPRTFTFVMIAAVYQEIYGPNACIGVLTGNFCQCAHLKIKIIKRTVIHLFLIQNSF